MHTSFAHGAPFVTAIVVVVVNVEVLVEVVCVVVVVNDVAVMVVVCVVVVCVVMVVLVVTVVVVVTVVTVVVVVDVQVPHITGQFARAKIPAAPWFSQSSFLSPSPQIGCSLFP